MAHYPQSATGLNYVTYPAGPTPNPGAGLTAGSANTKGSYTELTSSSGFECNSVRIKIQFCATTNAYFLFDLATGAAAAETVVVPNMTAENNGGSTEATGLYDLPLKIASGTRIAARCQSQTGSATMDIRLTLVAAGDTPGPTTYTAYGVSTANSQPTLVDPGGVADTKGSYSEIAASTSAVTQILVPMFNILGNGALTSAVQLVDIATGAAASEVVLIPDISLSYSSGSDSLDQRSYTFLTYIAASTRIAARASSQITDATDRRVFLGLLAATAPAESGGGTTGRQGLHAIEAGAV